LGSFAKGNKLFLFNTLVAGQNLLHRLSEVVENNYSKDAAVKLKSTHQAVKEHFLAFPGIGTEKASLLFRKF